MRQKVTLVTTLAIIAFTVVASQFVAGQEGPRYGGIWIEGMQIDISNFNLATHTHAESHLVGANVLQPLIEHDRGLNPIPNLAESWEISPDGKTVTFHLRHDVTWHDGKPFTSADVEYTFEEVTKEYQPGGKIVLGGLIDVETPDPYTAVLKLETPVPPSCTTSVPTMATSYLNICTRAPILSTIHTTLSRWGQGPLYSRSGSVENVSS